MKIHITLLIVGFFHLTIYSQSSDYEFLSKKLCEKFTENDLGLGKSDLFRLVQEKSAEVNRENREYISKLTQSLKATSDEKTDLLIAQEIANNISLATIEDCPIFTRISQKIAVLDHDSTKESVNIISGKTCHFLKDYKNVSYPDLNKILETIIFDLVNENESLIQKEYGTTGMKKFYYDLNGVLMSNCELFFKMTMDLQRK